MCSNGVCYTGPAKADQQPCVTGSAAGVCLNATCVQLTTTSTSTTVVQSCKNAALGAACNSGECKLLGFCANTICYSGPSVSDGTACSIGSCYLGSCVPNTTTTTTSTSSSTSTIAQTCVGQALGQLCIAVDSCHEAGVCSNGVCYTGPAKADQQPCVTGSAAGVCLNGSCNVLTTSTTTVSSSKAATSTSKSKIQSSTTSTTRKSDTSSATSTESATTPVFMSTSSFGAMETSTQASPSTSTSTSTSEQTTTVFQMVQLTYNVTLNIDYAQFDAASQLQFVNVLNAVYANVLGPSGKIKILGVYPGSVVVVISMFAMASTLNGQKAFCVVQGSVSDSTLTNALILSNSSLFSNVQVSVSGGHACSACSCTVTTAASTTASDASGSSSNHIEIIIPVVLGFFVLVLLVVIVARLRRLRVTKKRFEMIICLLQFVAHLSISFRLSRIHTYRAPDKIGDVDHVVKRAAWGEQPTSVVNKAAVVPVRPIIKSRPLDEPPVYESANQPDDDYFPETFFGGATRNSTYALADAGSRGLSRHKTMARATVPDTMSYYQAVKLGELLEQAPITPRLGGNKIAPGSAFVPLKPNESKKIDVRSPARVPGTDATGLGAFVRTLPETPAALRPWRPGMSYVEHNA